MFGGSTNPISLFDGTCLQLPTMVDVGDVGDDTPYLRDPTMGVLKVCLKVGDSPVVRIGGTLVLDRSALKHWPNQSQPKTTCLTREHLAVFRG